jgi:hypothetical protein
MLTSTIWLEKPQTKVVWLTLLLLSDRRGKVEGSVPGLAKEAVVTTEECEEALRILMAPDPYSRTKDFGGRRIEPMDGGWLILNHTKHKENMLDGKEMAKIRTARWRAKNRESDSATQPSHCVTGDGGDGTCDDLAHGSLPRDDLDLDRDQNQKERDQNLPKSRKRSSAAPGQSALELTPPEPADPSVPKPPSAHTQLVTHYTAEFERARQAKPCFGGREAKAVQSLLVAAQGDLERAKGFVTNAYTDPFWHSKATILDIAKDPSKFASRETLRPGQPGYEKWGPGGGNGPQPNDPDHPYVPRII